LIRFTGNRERARYNYINTYYSNTNSYLYSYYRITISRSTNDFATFPNFRECCYSKFYSSQYARF
jgi:hypothetical protein